MDMSPDDIENAYSFHGKAHLILSLIQVLHILENKFSPADLPANLIAALKLNVNPPSDAGLRTYHSDITNEWTQTFSVIFGFFTKCGPAPGTHKGCPAQIMTSLNGDTTASQSKLPLSD